MVSVRSFLIPYLAVSNLDHFLLWQLRQIQSINFPLFFVCSNSRWQYLFMVSMLLAILGIIFALFAGDSRADDQFKRQQLISSEDNFNYFYTKLRDLHKSPKVIRTLLMGLHLAACQQLCGINAFIFYSAGILDTIGFTADEAAIFSVCLAGGLIIGTFIGIACVEKYGRRFLMLWPMLILGICCFTFSIVANFSDSKHMPLCYLELIVIVIFELAFASGPGSIPWIFIPEAMTEDYRDLLNSFVAMVNWSCSFLVGILFPLLNSSIDNWTFMVFGGFCLYGFVIIYFYMPETKDKKPIEVQMDLPDNLYQPISNKSA